MSKIMIELALKLLVRFLNLQRRGDRFELIWLELYKDESGCIYIQSYKFPEKYRLIESY